MRRGIDFLRSGAIPQISLVAVAFVGFLTLLGVAVTPSLITEQSDIRIEPQATLSKPQQTFDVVIIVESEQPVNVFAGELRFDPTILQVSSIDYNTSIADLWAVLPWYSNGDGTLNFGGGTTREGGFTGTGELIQVTFKTLREGDGVITLHNRRVLLHDGLGTDAKLVAPIDAVLQIADAGTRDVPLAEGEHTTETVFTVAQNAPSTDLNNDGKQTIADVSIFMRRMADGESRYDFNLDGKVGLTDLNILLSAQE